jgi:hypothetical protein
LGERAKSSPYDLLTAVGGGLADSTEDAQARLFHRHVSTRFPDAVQGRHLAFGCIADDGAYFYCKDDLDGAPARAAEWVCTRLARTLGLPTADCAILLDPENGRELFGSKRLPSIADSFAVANFLSSPHKNELGEPGHFPGQYLARVRAFDMFIDNPDRGSDNFVLVRDGLQTNLCPNDFGSARLFRCTTDAFPVETERTVSVGKLHQLIHGPHLASAMEMLKELERVPATLIQSFLQEMPESWLSESQRGTFSGFWTNGQKEQRIAKLRSALTG